MDLVAVAFWGGFFGTAALMLVAALAAFVQSHHRVALAGGLSACASAGFAVVVLGWLPIGDPAPDARLVAGAGIVAALVLGLALLTDLGLMRDARRRRRILAAAAVAAVIAFATGWLLAPAQAMIYGTAVPLATAVAALPVAIFSARRGDRIAWFGAFAVASLVLALGGGLWVVQDRAGTSWPVHAASALAGMAYLTGIGGMLWLRYSYLIELREVIAQGPRYDPVTRMPSNAATGHLVIQAFGRQQQDPGRPLVLMAVSIGNLAELEAQHGRAAQNHALFVCASRLRRCVPAHIEMGRLFDDGFLLVSRRARGLEDLVALGRLVAQRLSKPVTVRSETGAEGERQASWAAQVGVGLLATTAQARPAAAVAEACDLSRMAWKFASRTAWRDRGSSGVAELSAIDTVL